MSTFFWLWLITLFYKLAGTMLLYVMKANGNRGTHSNWYPLFTVGWVRRSRSSYRSSFGKRFHKELTKVVISPKFVTSNLKWNHRLGPLRQGMTPTTLLEILNENVIPPLNQGLDLVVVQPHRWHSLSELNSFWSTLQE